MILAGETHLRWVTSRTGRPSICVLSLCGGDLLQQPQETHSVVGWETEVLSFSGIEILVHSWEREEYEKLPIVY